MEIHRRSNDDAGLQLSARLIWTHTEYLTQCVNCLRGVSSVVNIGVDMWYPYQCCTVRIVLWVYIVMGVHNMCTSITKMNRQL